MLKRHESVTKDASCVFHPGFAGARVRAEDDAADRGDEQHDRRDLEGQQMVGEEQAADLRRRAKRAVDLLGMAQSAAVADLALPGWMR